MMKRVLCLAFLTAILLAGPGMASGGGVWPAPLFVTVEFSSRVPDPYYVLSGPIETYRSYPVNGWLREVFEEYGRQKAGGGEQRGFLRIRVDELATRFRAVGSLGEIRPERVFKTAALRLGVGFDVDGKTLAERDLRVVSDLTLAGDATPASSLYDFEDVFGRVIAKALEETDSVVEEGLRASGWR